MLLGLAACLKTCSFYADQIRGLEYLSERQPFDLECSELVLRRILSEVTGRTLRGEYIQNKRHGVWKFGDWRHIAVGPFCQQRIYTASLSSIQDDVSCDEVMGPSIRRARHRLRCDLERAA